MFPNLIVIGPFRLATYGVLVAAGYLIGILWLRSRRSEMGLDEERFWGLIYAIFFGAILGGKLLYWAVEWRSLVSGELHIIRDLRFGFVFFGGFLGSCLAGIYYARRCKLKYLKLADYFGAALPMGHMVGRLGCLAAGCCAGRPTAMPWGVRFTHPDSLVALHLRGVPLHPTQLYESLLDAAIVVVLLRALKRVRSGKLPQGAVFLGYVVLYSAGRFIIEFFRGDDRGGFLLGMSVSQWISLACLLGSAWAWRRLKKRRRRG